MNKKTVIFYADFVIIALGFLGFFLCSDAVKNLFTSLVTVLVVPIITALNVGISASVYQDKKRITNDTKK